MDAGLGRKTAALVQCRLYTTLAVYNISRRCTQAELVEDWWPVDGSYDFLHVRHTSSIARRAKVVHINFLTPDLAAAFCAQWQGRELPPHVSSLPLQIFAAPVQGRDSNLLLTLDGTHEPPVLVLFGRRVADQESRTAVRLAKSGVFVTAI